MESDGPGEGDRDGAWHKLWDARAKQHTVRLQLPFFATHSVRTPIPVDLQLEIAEALAAVSSARRDPLVDWLALVAPHSPELQAVIAAVMRARRDGDALDALLVELAAQGPMPARLIPTALLATGLRTNGKLWWALLASEDDRVTQLFLRRVRFHSMIVRGMLGPASAASALKLDSIEVLRQRLAAGPDPWVRCAASEYAPTAQQRAAERAGQIATIGTDWRIDVTQLMGPPHGEPAHAPAAALPAAATVVEALSAPDHNLRARALVAAQHRPELELAFALAIELDRELVAAGYESAQTAPADVAVAELARERTTAARRGGVGIGQQLSDDLTAALEHGPSALAARIASELGPAPGNDLGAWMTAEAEVIAELPAAVRARIAAARPPAARAATIPNAPTVTRRRELPSWLPPLLAGGFVSLFVLIPAIGALLFAAVVHRLTAHELATWLWLGALLAAIRAVVRLPINQARLSRTAQLGQELAASAIAAGAVLATASWCVDGVLGATPRWLVIAFAVRLAARGIALSARPRGWYVGLSLTELMVLPVLALVTSSFAFIIAGATATAIAIAAVVSIVPARPVDATATAPVPTLAWGRWLNQIVGAAALPIVVWQAGAVQLLPYETALFVATMLILAGFFAAAIRTSKGPLGVIAVTVLAFVACRTIGPWLHHLLFPSVVDGIPLVRASAWAALAILPAGLSTKKLDAATQPRLALGAAAGAIALAVLVPLHGVAGVAIASSLSLAVNLALRVPLREALGRAGSL